MSLWRHRDNGLESASITALTRKQKKNLDLDSSAGNLSPKLQAYMFTMLFIFEVLAKANFIFFPAVTSTHFKLIDIFFAKKTIIGFINIIQRHNCQITIPKNIIYYLFIIIFFLPINIIINIYYIYNIYIYIYFFVFFRNYLFFLD